MHRREKTHLALLIPAFKPEPKILELTDAIDRRIYPLIVIVNDGSGAEFQNIFDELRDKEGVIVLRNAVNQGKGAALKRGINYILTDQPQIRRIITADADGQHTAHDIEKVGKVSERHENQLVLGVRSFDKNTPLRSYLGNKVSSFAFRALLGISLSDTQTGLRSLPAVLARSCLTLQSNRYEFETEMLALARSKGSEMIEVPIETVYDNKNESSHFNPVLDSAAIYFTAMRYSLSSIATAAVDFFIFSFAILTLDNVLAANLCARSVTVFVQFFLLKKMVFQVDTQIYKFFIFLIYVVFIGLLVGTLQIELSDATGLGVFSSKVLVETLFFVFNFLFLKEIIFRRSEK